MIGGKYLLAPTGLGQKDTEASCEDGDNLGMCVRIYWHSFQGTSPSCHVLSGIDSKLNVILCYFSGYGRWMGSWVDVHIQY